MSYRLVYRKNTQRHLIAFNNGIKQQCNCSIGNRFEKCVSGDPCDPVEGSFVTECNVKGCKNFGL